MPTQPPSKAAQRWHAVRYWFNALKPCILPLIISVAVPLTFFFVQQATEVLLCLLQGPPKTHPGINPQFLSAAAALTALCLAQWYFSRVLLYIQFPGSPSTSMVASHTWLKFATDWIPRALGVIPAIGLGLALIIAVPSRQAPAGSFGNRLWIAMIFCFLVAVLLMTFFVKRKHTRPPFYCKNFDGLDSDTRKVTLSCICISITLFVLVVAFPVGIAQTLGSAAIIMLAAASWTTYGSLVIYFGHMRRIPVAATLILLLALCSLLNDNHKIRTIKNSPPPNCRDIETCFNSWYSNLCVKFPAEQQHPVIVVAAAGGGIRAAMWTATVLSALQDANPSFADHVFAVSSVSGGSLGTAVFGALLNQNCVSGGVLTNAQDVLSHDFLSPTLAFMLFPDLLQRFLPPPIPPFDRARALECAWEDGWRRSRGNSLFSGDFMSLWTTPGQSTPSHQVPAFFFNGTLVETGDRVITSNLRIDDSFKSCEESSRWLDRAISLSTAVHMSARFTYVSPAGVLTNGYHVVDGGYFENSGAATALDILEDIEETSKANGYHVRFIGILITSEGAVRVSADQVRPAPNLLSEALNPAWALLNTRGARAIYAETALKASYPGNVFQLNLANTNTTFPLGWSLSQHSIHQMNAVLKAPEQSDQLAAILNLLPKSN